MSRDVPPILPDFIDPDDLAVLGDAECPAFSGDLMRYEATVQAAEAERDGLIVACDLALAERDAAEERADALRAAHAKIIHEYRDRLASVASIAAISATALAADDAKRGEA